MDTQDVARRSRAHRHAGPEPVSLLLVDEHSLTRAGVRTILELETDFHVLDDAASVDEALAVCAREQPDVVLVDLDTAAGELVSEIERLRTGCAGAAIVILSHGDSDNELYTAAVAGAAGHVATVSDPAELARVIGRAARGEQPIGQQLGERPQVGQRVLQTFQQMVVQGAEHAPEPTLGERELDVLRLAAEGLTNAQIGQRLGLSGNTVKSVVTGILRRLGVRYRTQAVVHALREGWIEMPSQRPDSADDSRS